MPSGPFDYIQWDRHGVKEVDTLSIFPWLGSTRPTTLLSKVVKGGHTARDTVHGIYTIEYILRHIKTKF